MSVINIVTKPEGSGTESIRSPSERADCNWPTMKPTGTILNFLAAFSRRIRACWRAGSSSKVTWPKRTSALRTWAGSWIGSRR